MNWQRLNMFTAVGLLLLLPWCRQKQFIMMLQIKLIVRVPCLLPFIDGFDEPTMTDRDRFRATS